MSEIITILEQNHPIPIKQISSWFREQHSKLKISDQKSFFEFLFSIFSKKTNEYTIDEWDRLRLIACIFTIAFDPPFNIYEVHFPKKSENGYLVSSSFILLLPRPKPPEFFDFFHKYFYDRLDSLFKTKPDSLFYDISNCYYFLINSHIFNDFVSQSPIYDDLHFIFQKICQINIEQLTFSSISFINYAYHHIKTSIMTNRQIALSDDFIQSFLHILDLSPKSPDIFLLIFFHSWFYFVKQCKSLFNTDQLLEKLPMITSLFEYTSKNKYHELHRSFPWYLCFYFYDFIPVENHNQRIKVLSLICNAIRRIKRMDNFPRILESIKMFSISIVQQYIDNNPYDLFYMLSNLNLSLNAFIFKLDKLHAVSKIVPKIENANSNIHGSFTPETNDNKNELAKENSKTNGNETLYKKRQISFYEQSNWPINSPSIDRYLNSNSYEKIYQNDVECAKDFEQIVQNCEEIRHHFHSLVIFQIQICVCIRKLLSTNKTQVISTLNLFHYLLETYSSLINVMVHTSYKQMEIQSFATHEVLIGAPVSSHCLPYIANPQALLVFNGIFQKYFDDCILKMPVSFLDALAMKVSENLFILMKKRILTYNFLVTFASFQKDHANPNSFINLLLNRMMEFASKQIGLITSSSIDDVNLFFLWIAFTIRLAELIKGNPNQLFGNLLMTYQKLIIVSVFSNLKSISHQSVAIRMVHYYIKAVDYNFDQIDSQNSKFSLGRIRPILIEDFEENAILDGISVVFDICLKEPDFMNENSLIPLIKYAYESKNTEIVEKASKICLRIFTPERSNNNPITSVVELEEQVFESFMNSIISVDFEIAKQILDILPYYSSKFLKAFSSIKLESLLTMDFDNLDFHLILKTISEHFDNSIEEATHLFALVSIYFEIIIYKINKTNEILKPILTSLVKLLKHCYGFDHLKEPMSKLLSYLTRVFGDMFIRGESNLYILCVLEVMGVNRSDSTSFIMKLAVSFFNYCMDKEINPNFVTETLDSLFTFFPISTKFFSILGGFSMFIRYYPQFITLNYIRSLVIQTSEVSTLDKSYPSVLNMFLKKFFEKSDEQTLKKFVLMSYEIICPLSISVRHVIEKRLFKLKIPLPINNLDSIANSSDRIIMFQKLTLAFLCGIEGDLISCLNQEWVDSIIQFFKPNSNENIHCLQKYVRVLSLCLAILRDPKIFKFFISSADFFNNLTRFLCSTLFCHFLPVKKSAKKCFKILKNNYYSDLISVKMIDDFWRNPKNSFSFWGTQPEKIAFYAKLTKILPCKTPPDIIIDYFIEVENYCKKPDIEKMKLIKNFTIILKQFAIKDYISLEPVKAHILNDSSYLENYIECILSLYQNTLIPFKTLTKKHVLKFLILFPDQTVNYLINASTSPTLFNFYFLNDIIIEDETGTFFQSFLHSFDENYNFASMSPYLSSIFEKLSTIDRFAKEQTFFALIHKSFSQVIRTCPDSTKSTVNGYSVLTTLCITFLNILKYNFELINIVHFSSILRISFFNQSYVYHLFKQIIFDQNYPLVILNIIKASLKSFQQLPSSMTRVLLPYSIKALGNIDQIPSTIFAGIWKQLMNHLDNEEKITSILKSMKYMLDIEIPTKEQLSAIFSSFKKYIMSADSQTIVYALKLAIKLAEINLLPKQIFEAIIQQFFSYAKFFEIPYFSYFLKLLKAKPNFIENLSPKVIETMSYFFHDRFYDVKDIQKTITVLLVTTELYKYLPFSLFYATFNLIIKKLKIIRKQKEKSKVDLNEIRDILIFLIPLFGQAETNLVEQKMLQKTCFKYMKLVLITSDQSLIFGSQVTDFNESFFVFLAKSEKVEFPKKILQYVNTQVTDSVRFCLVCIAGIYEPDFLFIENPKLIESSLEFIRNDDFISKAFIQSFMKFIFDPNGATATSASKLVYLHYQEQIHHIVHFLLDHLSIANFEKFSIIVSSFISSHIDPNSSQLVDKILSVYFKMEEPQLSNLMFQLILNLSGHLPFEEQMSYIKIIINQKEWDLSMKKIFTTNLPSLISCPTLSNKAKMQLLSIFPTNIQGTETELLKIIHTVKKFGEESSYSVLGTLILLYTFIADNSAPLTIFLCFEKIEELLMKINGFKERIRTFLRILPLTLWSDEYFIYIVAILSEKNKLWYPIFSFSKRMKKIASNIAIVNFSSKIDGDVLSDIKLFFDHNLVKDTEFKYTQIIRTIELLLLKTSKTFSYSNFSRLSEPFSDKIFLTMPHGFIHFDESYLSKLLYPDSFNDSIINEVMPNATPRQEAAIFLSHLCKYEAAEQLFILEEQNKNLYFEFSRKFNSNFITTNDLDFDKIIRPLLKIGHHHEKIIDNLRKCVEFIFSGDKEKSLEYLKLVKDGNLHSYRKNLSPTVYQREKIVSFAIIEIYIEKLLTEGNIPKFNKENLFQCLNSAFVNMIKNFKRFLLKKEPKEKNKINSSDESPSILISPSIYSHFKEISGITPHGQFALNATQINHFFNKISQQISSKNFTVSNWISFAPFCFNVFIAQQTEDIFSTAYNAYCQIIISKNDVSIIQLNEASARIITLIRIAISLKKFTKPILSYSFIFKKMFAKVWHVWLQQLVEIANSKWFFDIAIELFTEMAYRSTLYASKYASKDVQNALHNAIVNEHSFVQISMMNKIAKILNRINSIQLNEIELQTKIQTFIDESLHLTEDQISSFNLMEIRRHRNFITPFEVALSNLTKSEIEKIGDFKNWINEIRRLTNEEREHLIQEFTNSSQSLSQLLNQLYEVIDEFNEQMPFIFPIRGNEFNTEFSIFVIHKRIKVFSPQMTTFSSTTSIYSKQYFLIMTKNPDGFRPSIISLNHFLSVIRTILRSSYSTIVRSITLAENYCFEIGPNTILKRLESEPISLKTFFERDMMITQEDWIKENIDQQSLKGSEIGKLNQNGMENIKTFPNDSLLYFLKSNYAPKLCTFNPHGIAVSYVSMSLTRYILSAPYSDLNMMIMCAKSLQLPVLSIDFEKVKFTEETPYSNFRFSPSIERICGIWGNCGLKMAFSATAIALVDHLELLRTHLEIILGDEMILNSSSNFSIEELIKQRTVIENRFISLSPPNYISKSEEESISWIQRINDLIEKSKNPWIQPAKSIPWY